MMRAMWIHYPDDIIARGIGDQYLWGRDMIVAPVYEKGATSRKVYLPEGKWYDWWDNTEYEGGKFIRRSVNLSIMPVFARAGAVIPFDPTRQYTSQQVDEPLEIRIYAGSEGFFNLYEDDGVSLDYLENKNITKTEFHWDDKKAALTIKPHDDSSLNAGNRERKFRLKLLPSGEEKLINYKGKKIIISLKNE